jgi:phosphatidylglycerophosphate synthase
VVIIATVLVVVLTTEIRRFPPSLMGKLNTAVQIATIFAVLAHNYLETYWTRELTNFLVAATAGTVLLSSVHYALEMSRRLHLHHHSRSSRS